MKRLISFGVLAVALSFLLGGTDQASALPPPQLQGLEQYQISCLGGADPDQNVLPLTCPGPENKATGATPVLVGATLEPAGNRPQLGYGYVGPGWPDGQDPVDGEKVADNISTHIDYGCDGLVDKLGSFVWVDSTADTQEDLLATLGSDTIDITDSTVLPANGSYIRIESGIAGLRTKTETMILVSKYDGPPGSDTMTVTRFDPSTHATGARIDKAQNTTTAGPYDFVSRTTDWGPGTGINGEDESYLDEIIPTSLGTVVDRARAAYTHLWWAGTTPPTPIAIPPAPIPVDSITIAPSWQPGARFNVVTFGGAPTSPTGPAMCMDTPQGGLGHNRGLYGPNPDTPGLYARWTTSVGYGDFATGVLNFVYMTNCKAIGGSFTDADWDCLASADGAHPAPVGAAVDPDDSNPDIDGDGLLDGIEVAWGSSPASGVNGLYRLKGANTVNDEGGGADASETVITMSGTTGLGVGTIIRIDDEVMVITGISSNDVTVQRAVLSSTAAAHSNGARVDVISVDSASARVLGQRLVDTTRKLDGGVDDSQTTITLDNNAGIAAGDLLTVNGVSSEMMLVTAVSGNGTDITVQRAVGGTSAFAHVNGKPVQRAPRVNPEINGTDTDADGYTDLEEMVGPSYLLTNPISNDTDGDTFLDRTLKVDTYSIDSPPGDGIQDSGPPDGIPDWGDWNGDNEAPGPTDNGMSDNVDTSGDGSSIRNVGYVITSSPRTGDNCPNVDNAGQENADDDAYGDACDSDADNDGMTNGAEPTNGWSGTGCINDSSAVTDPLNPDSDGDGVRDGVECALGSNPRDAASKPAMPPAANDPDMDGLSNASETAYRTQGFSGTVSEDVEGDTLVGQNDPDCDNDAVWDGCEILYGGTNPLRADSDEDTIADIKEPNTRSNTMEIGNGASIITADISVPWQGSPLSCSLDGDNDGIPNASDPNPGGDVTYDDDGDGMACIATGGGDPTDTGPSWDANCNAKLDGKEASCPLATNPTADDDGDGLLNTWEVCKWGTDPNVVDSDGDGKGDCIEACDTDGNGLCGFGDDALNSARATLLPAGIGAGKFGKDGDFDLNGNNLLSGDFGNDTITTAKYAFKILACK
jgi:hypothetical protein